MSNEDDGPEDRHLGHGSGSPPPYWPSSQFKEISKPPLLPKSLPANAELWLVRIQDNQLKADEFKEKQVQLTLNTSDGKMGSFEDSKGTPFEILDLQSASTVKPFAFLPKGDSLVEVQRISRQVAIVRRLDNVALSKPTSSLSVHFPSEMVERDNVRPLQECSNAPSIFNENSRGTGLSQVIQESHGGSSIQVGGIPTIEILQSHEQKISPRKLSKQSNRGQPSVNLEAERSPLASPQYSDVNQHASSKKSRKHRRTK